MRFEEVELWEIVLPHSIEYGIWYRLIHHLLIEGSFLFFNDSLISALARVLPFARCQPEQHESVTWAEIGATTSLSSKQMARPKPICTSCLRWNQARRVYGLAMKSGQSIKITCITTSANKTPIVRGAHCRRARKTPNTRMIPFFGMAHSWVPNPVRAVHYHFPRACLLKPVLDL